MPGDPNECRKHARNCLRIAEASANAEITRTFVDFAHSAAPLGGVCLWHKADMLKALTNVRFWAQSGHRLYPSPMSANDPKRTCQLAETCGRPKSQSSDGCCISPPTSKVA